MTKIRLKDIPIAVEAKPPNSSGGPITTPSQHPFPVFALCPPVYVDNVIANNETMKSLKGEGPIDRDKFIAQWYNFYNIVAANSLVYLITPVKGFQDQTYVNSAVYLPHFKEKDVIILSNFTGEGRAGEEIVAGSLFKDLGYEVVKCPYKFEAEPELKWFKDNLYLGGYGFRSDIRAHEWLENTYDCKIIKIKETDKILYHLDCSVFPLDDETAMICADIMDKKTVKEINEVLDIRTVTRSQARAGICNSLRVENVIHNASSLQYMKKTDEFYDVEKNKNEALERICTDMGFELVFHHLDSCESSGAMLSCFVMTLSNSEVRFK